MLSASSPALHLQKRDDSVMEGTGGVEGRSSLRNAVQGKPRPFECCQDETWFFPVLDFTSIPVLDRTEF